MGVTFCFDFNWLLAHFSRILPVLNYIVLDLPCMPIGIYML